jgi:hypothetical protein
MSHEMEVRSRNALMELCPKKIVDKLARPGIIVRRLILENEVCKEGNGKRMNAASIRSSVKSVNEKVERHIVTHRRPSGASRQRYRARSC